MHFTLVQRTTIAFGVLISDNAGTRQAISPPVRVVESLDGSHAPWCPPQLLADGVGEVDRVRSVSEHLQLIEHCVETLLIALSSYISTYGKGAKGTREYGWVCHIEGRDVKSSNGE